MNEKFVNPETIKFESEYAEKNLSVLDMLHHGASVVVSRKDINSNLPYYIIGTVFGEGKLYSLPLPVLASMANTETPDWMHYQVYPEGYTSKDLIKWLETAFGNQFLFGI